MLQPRRNHCVIEVPEYYCQIQRFSPPAPDSAAMVIGGLLISAISEPYEPLDSVELFGCPNAGGESVYIDPYLVRVFLAGGTYYPSEVEGELGKVVVCGGSLCDTEGDCDISNDCYEWTPENRWLPAAPSNELRWANLMALVPDLDSGSNDRVPVMLGLGNTPEIYDPQEDVWRLYRELDASNWNSLGCLFQFQDSIFHIRLEVYELNTLTWELTQIALVPEVLYPPGRCALATIGDTQGKLNDCPEVPSKKDLKSLHM